jgi:hypothetical protein
VESGKQNWKCEKQKAEICAWLLLISAFCFYHFCFPFMSLMFFMVSQFAFRFRPGPSTLAHMKPAIQINDRRKKAQKAQNVFLRLLRLLAARSFL